MLQVNFIWRYLFTFCLFFLPLSIRAETAEEFSVPQADIHSVKEADPFPFDAEELHADETDKFFREVLKMLGTLGLLILVMVVASWMLKRMLNTRVQQLNTSSFIKITEKRALSNKSALYLLEIQGKSFIIGESTNGLVLLGSSREQFSSLLEEDPEKPRRPIDTL